MRSKQEKKPGDKGTKPSNSKSTGEKAPSQAKPQWWFQHADPVSRFTGWLAIWTGVLCFVTIGLGFIALLQWRELHSTDHNIAEQAKISAAQLEIMRAGQRAWVSINSIEIGEPLEIEGEFAKVGMKYVLQNTGNLPALRVEVIAHIYPNRKFEGIPPKCTAKQTGARWMGESLFPNAPHNNWMSWYATTDNGGEITPIPKSGTYSLHVAGCILYESAGDPTIHLTAFTGLILPKRNTGGPYFDTAKTRYEVNEIGFTLLTTIGQDAK